jgi:hypothetical protein
MTLARSIPRLFQGIVSVDCAACWAGMHAMIEWPKVFCLRARGVKDDDGWSRQDKEGPTG